MRIACRNCNLPLIVASEGAAVGLPCPRCHQPLSAPKSRGSNNYMLTFGALFVCGVVPFLLVLYGPKDLVDPCITLVLSVLNR